MDETTAHDLFFKRLTPLLTNTNMDEYGNYLGGYQEEVEKPSGFKRFFFACAGAYIRILEICPSEHTKYVGIGATIFLTACLAIISGSFAIYTLVDNAIVAFLFGLLWGALIFNLDRYIVSSLRKEGRVWHELGLAFPRLLLSVLISIVITKPIEVELFRNQINAELLEYTTMKEKEAESQLEAKLGLDSIYMELAYVDSVRRRYKQEKDGKPSSYDFDLVSGEFSRSKRLYDSLLKVYTPRIQANEKQRTFLWNKYATPIYETTASGEERLQKFDFPKKWQDRSDQLYRINKGLKEELAEKLTVVQKLEKERKGARDAFAQSMAEELTLLQSRREELITMKQEKEAIRKEQLPGALEAARRYGVGFPARIQVLEKMKDEDSSIWWTSNLIVALFILLETSPVFVKLISKRGPYDYLLSRIEHHKKVESLRYISDMNYDLNASMRLQSRQNGHAINGKTKDEIMIERNK
ncbi:MAG: DUF4407 domain-containing protein [Bacteroidota bacterium]